MIQTLQEVSSLRPFDTDNLIRLWIQLVLTSQVSLNINGMRQLGCKDCQGLCTYCAKDSRYMRQSGGIELTSYTVSATFLQVFNFSNFQLFVKMHHKILDTQHGCDIQAWPVHLTCTAQSYCHLLELADISKAMPTSKKSPWREFLVDLAAQPQ